MTYSVEIAPRAVADIASQVRFIARVRMEPISAEHWKEGLLDLIAGLSEFPRSHPIVPEFIDFDVELRHAIYFSHRVVFKVSDKERIVSVVRVLHGGRNELFI